MPPKYSWCWLVQAWLVSIPRYLAKRFNFIAYDSHQQHEPSSTIICQLPSTIMNHQSLAKNVLQKNHVTNDNTKWNHKSSANSPASQASNLPSSEPISWNHQFNHQITSFNHPIPPQLVPHPPNLSQPPRHIGRLHRNVVGFTVEMADDAWEKVVPNKNKRGD